jgi:hypothetical protein
MAKGLLFFASILLLIAACTTSETPTTPTSAASVGNAPLAHQGHGAATVETSGVNNPNSGAHDDKGYIDGWFNGERVQLYYTKTFFCAEPPTSQAEDSGCELGADAETAPRPGPIPTIYAIAAVGGIQPPLATLSCPAGSVCLNHPAHIDASRVGGLPNSPAVPHSHILSEHAGGWFHTVNIRVRDLNVWNQIAAAKSLAKVRELQADPIVGVNGQRLIFPDAQTNIFFFIASWRPVHE